MIMNLRTMFSLLTFLLVVAGPARAELNVYLENLNLSARADLGDFEAHLGARFGTSQAQLEVVLSNVDSPADAALVLWLGERSRQPVNRVLQVYRQEKSQGWGVIARNLGIKPGSADFHALKNGNLDFHPSGHSGGKPAKGKKNKNHKGKKS